MDVHNSITSSLSSSSAAAAAAAAAQVVVVVTSRCIGVASYGARASLDFQLVFAIRAGAESTLGARHFVRMYEKLAKCPNFT